MLPQPWLEEWREHFPWRSGELVPALSLPLIGRVPGRSLVIPRLQFPHLSGEQPLKVLQFQISVLKVALQRPATQAYNWEG